MKKSGFTMLELMVVMSIIIIFATITLVMMSSSRNAAADARVKSQLRSFMSAAETYYLSQYPNSYGASVNNCSSGVFADSNAHQEINPTYLPSGVTLACYANNSNYAISISLKTGGYLCADSLNNFIIRSSALNNEYACQ